MKMTKKTTKNLTWKLDKLPTASELSDLVDSGVITKEEARDIMFGNPESDKDKVEALEKLVEFLQGLVTDLSKNRTTFVPYERTVYVDRRIRPYWDNYWLKTDKVLSQNGFSLSSEKTGSLSSTSFTSGFVSTAKSLPNSSIGGTISTFNNSSSIDSDALNLKVDSKIS